MPIGAPRTKQAKVALKTYYQVLAVPPSASAEQIHKAFKTLALKLAPRLAGDGGSEQYKEITRAWGVLRDTNLRRKYDGTLGLIEDSVCNTCRGKGTLNIRQGFFVAGTKPCYVCGGSGRATNAGQEL